MNAERVKSVFKMYKLQCVLMFLMLNIVACQYNNFRPPQGRYRPPPRHYLPPREPPSGREQHLPASRDTGPPSGRETIPPRDNSPPTVSPFSEGAPPTGPSITVPQANVCSPETCRLPECMCAGKEAPGGMDKSKIPQMVMFTFDDAINEQVFKYYKQLFPSSRINPNGCPISVTFFVSHNWTNYDMVKQMYMEGHEIASHSVTHRMPQSWWSFLSYANYEREMEKQRTNLIQKGSVPKSAITGVRIPFLETGGDTEFQFLKDYGYTYDASFMSGPHPEGGAWPFTLDYPPSVSYCSNTNCPKGKHPGIWEVPLNRWIGPDGKPCSMVDACSTQPANKGEALSYLWQNFNRHYYGNRSPVGVNMHAVWFQTPHHLEAMEEFVNTLSEMEDVYIITVQQTLSWVQDPVTLEAAKTYKPWACEAGHKNGKKLVKIVYKSDNDTPKDGTNSEEDDEEDDDEEKSGGKKRGDRKRVRKVGGERKGDRNRQTTERTRNRESSDVRNTQSRTVKRRNENNRKGSKTSMGTRPICITYVMLITLITAVLL